VALRTGDIGRIEGGRLYIASRKRDLILRGGENVYPAEIELCLETHPEVLEAAVVGREHEELGQEVEAVVVLVDGSKSDTETLRAWVAERLAYYKVPAHWQFRDQPLPRNASGKVMKHLLGEGIDNPFVDD
jgi:acyl-CoA synthetase (AMP-forming)/AMP-acid ligase II